MNLGVRYEYYTPFFSPSNELSMFDVDKGEIVIAEQGGESRYIIDAGQEQLCAARRRRLQDQRQDDACGAASGCSSRRKMPSATTSSSTRPSIGSIRCSTAGRSTSCHRPLSIRGPFPTGYQTYNIDRRFQRGYSHQYNLAVQREIPGGFLVEAAYVGSQGHNLPFSVNINQAGPDGTPAPFPDLGNVGVVQALGDSSYHSGQFKLERRFSQGVFVLATYTWSKSIDTLTLAVARGGRRAERLRSQENRGLSDWDVPHRFALSYVWELPYGTESAVGKRRGAMAQALLGDWQMTGIFAARSGYPGQRDRRISARSPVPGDARPDLLHDPNPRSSERTAERWFDTTAFEANKGADR